MKQDLRSVPTQPPAAPGTDAHTHTPGPWTIHADTDGWPLVMSGGAAGRIVANVNPQSCPNESSAPAFVVMPAEDNARLIAAAPDLLDALKLCQETIARLRYDNASAMAEETFHDANDAARAAITKATGARA